MEGVLTESKSSEDQIIDFKETKDGKDLKRILREQMQMSFPTKRAKLSKNFEVFKETIYKRWCISLVVIIIVVIFMGWE